jgi:phosphatidylglycerol lysyltransferase
MDTVKHENKFIRHIPALLGLVIFVFALWVLERELKATRFHDLRSVFRSFPLAQLIVAALITILNYIIVTGYDVLALNYIKHPLKYREIVFTSIAANAIGNNAGTMLLSGGIVRYRLYSTWKISVFETLQVVAFNSVTFGLGVCLLAGVSFTCIPVVLPNVFHVGLLAVRCIGIFFLCIICAYTSLSLVWKKTLHVRKWHFEFPPFPIAVGQITLALVDWLLSLSVLYVLLPRHMMPDFFMFISIFMAAQIAGMLSQLPGGIGVFEAVIVSMLSSQIPLPHILTALLFFRVIYYILPLLLVTVVIGISEIKNTRRIFEKIIPYFPENLSIIVPKALFVGVFIAGVVLLFSGVLPRIPARVEWVNKLLPLSFLEISHFLGSLTGVGLLFLARGIQKRSDIAYIITVVLLAVASVLSLINGFHYEQALLLFTLFLVMVPTHRYFYRKTSFLSELFTAPWLVAIGALIMSSVWLGFFAYKHVDYSNDLWWQFTLHGNASRFLRSEVGIAVFLMILSLMKLIRPPHVKQAAQNSDIIAAVAKIVNKSIVTNSNLAFLGDKLFMVSKSGDTFLMYGIQGRSVVALNGPYGPQKEWDVLIDQFQELCDVHDSWPVIYDVAAEYLHFYLDRGLSAFKIGEEARVDLTQFSLEGSEHSVFRHTIRHSEKEGACFEIIPSEKVAEILPECKRISDKWLMRKNVHEKGFSMGFFNEDYLRRFSFAIVRQGTAIVAFANLWFGADKEEFSIDLMRYLPDEAPQSIMQYLFLKIILWGKNDGYRWFNMGLAPLAGLCEHEWAPLWNRFGNFIFMHGERFYNFQGLRAYKQKYSPEWRPRYLIAPGGVVLPQIVADIVALGTHDLKKAFMR